MTSRPERSRGPAVVRTLLALVVLLTLAPFTLHAQRDSSALRRAPDGLVLDFVDTDVGIVLRAIAEAGGLSITLSNLPSERVTLRLQQPTSRETALDALRAVAEGHGITITEGSSVVRLVGPPRTPPNARPAPRELSLYTLRLRHTAAADMAPLLMSVLTGSGGTVPTSRGGTTLGGIQAIQRGGVAPTPRGAARPTTPSAAPPNEVVAVPIRDANGRVTGMQVTSRDDNAFSDTRIVADEATNALVVRATADDFAAIRQLVGTLDLRPLQVLIEVTIAQVDRSGDLSLGVSGTATRREGQSAGDTLGRLPGAGTARDFVAMLTGGRGTVDFDLAINALQTRGDVKLLSLPVIIAQNNREATLNVGSEVPFVQVSQTGGFDPLARVQTIQYASVGKQLTITPTISIDGYVNMDVIQTNDDVSNALLFDAPIINQRQAQTSVFVRDGQTTVIGGLTDNTTDESTAGVPLLSRIPLLGWMFGSTRRSTRTSELYLFLTPHIVSSDEDLDRLREQVRDGSELLQSVPVRRPFAPRPDSVPPRDDDANAANAARPERAPW